MIQVTRLNGEEVYVNADLILFLEKSPDTVLTLTSGKKVMVQDAIPDILDKIVKFKSRCFPRVAERSADGGGKEG
jgi:flagellar protein FlbD